jgi:MFS family permease
MLGPLAAFVILALAPYRFDAVFLLSFGVGIIGVGVLLGLVTNVGDNERERSGDGTPAPLNEVSERHNDLFRDAGDLVRDPHFRRILLAGSALALVTMSDPFVYLALQQQAGFAPQVVPLLFVVTSLAYLMLAVPVGYLADRIGGGLVFLGGHLVLLAAYATLLTPGLGSFAMWMCPALLGTYYAATDGVLPAMASLHVAGRFRGSGLAVLGTATSLCRLIASLALGWIWTSFTRETAVFTFMVGLAAAIVPVGLVLAGLRASGARSEGA